MTSFAENRPIIYTIGHSNHTLETFLGLLTEKGIQVIVDVRSDPASRVVPHFNRQFLENSARNAGFKYLYLGEELGGRPKGNEFYDADGYVLYNLIASTDAFKQGIFRLIEGIKKYRVTLLCGEENPRNCHRRLLIGRVLRDQGVAVEHIRGNGRVQSDDDLLHDDNSMKPGNHQLGLFKQEETSEWKSTRSVLQKRRPKSSSEH